MMDDLFKKIRMDMAWLNIVDQLPTPPNCGRLKLVVLVIKHSVLSESFHAVLLHRLSYSFRKSNCKLLSLLCCRLLQRRYGTTIAASANIGGGFRLPHPYGLIIGAHVEIGNMVTVGQHVTLGGNFGSQGNDGRLFPCIGSWTWITAGVVVAGPVRIGEDVIIGANAVVTKDIPDHAIVGGVPAKLIRMREPASENAENPNFFQYYGYPSCHIEKFQSDMQCR